MKAVLRPHPLAEAIPAMSDPEYVELRDDIEENGLLQPIILFDGQILDGRHRYKASLELRKDPKTKNFTGDANAALAYVISANLKRRNLTKGQRAAAAAKLATMRQGERTDLEPSANLPKVSQAEAAAAMQVSERSVGQVEQIERDAPDLVPKIESGELTLNKAATITKQRKAKASKPKVEPKRVSVKEHVDDCRTCIAKHFLAIDGLEDRADFLKRVNAILKQFAGDINKEARAATKPVRETEGADALEQFGAQLSAALFGGGQDAAH